MNLSEIIVRPGDDLETLKRKARYATVLGTLQATLDNFRYLRKVWSDNQREERLLGVSMTGVMDHSILNGSSGNEILIEWLQGIKLEVIETNERWANILGINKSKQLTLVKPSGTVSQLCGTSSGIHPRFANYYIRRVTQDIKDPLTDLMIDEGIPYVITGEKAIFSFPIKSPGGITAKEIDPIQQLELWEIYRDHWCDGNPSQTIYYTDNNFLDIQAWVFRKWSKIGGLSFFPLDDNVYANAPYEEITEEKYEEFKRSFPSVRWYRLPEFEMEDRTTGMQEYACVGGSCEL